jgi:hypothetical protein
MNLPFDLASARRRSREGSARSRLRKVLTSTSARSSATSSASIADTAGTDLPVMRVRAIIARITVLIRNRAWDAKLRCRRCRNQPDYCRLVLGARGQPLDQGSRLPRRAVGSGTPAPDRVRRLVVRERDSPRITARRHRGRSVRSGHAICARSDRSGVGAAIARLWEQAKGGAPKSSPQSIGGLRKGSTAADLKEVKGATRSGGRTVIPCPSLGIATLNSEPFHTMFGLATGWPSDRVSSLAATTVS